MDGFEDESFEVAIDKGTLDAMISGSLWDPPPEVRKNTSEYIDEVDEPLELSFNVTTYDTSGLESAQTRRRILIHYISTASLHETHIEEKEMGPRG